MKALRDMLSSWSPFGFAAALCYLVIANLSAPDMKSWEPAFYSFLPLCFFLVGFGEYRTRREVRELREALTALQSARNGERVAV